MSDEIQGNCENCNRLFGYNKKAVELFKERFGDSDFELLCPKCSAKLCVDFVG